MLSAVWPADGGGDPLSGGGGGLSKLANGTARLHPQPPLPQRICWANHTLNIVPHALVHGRRESNHSGKAARVPRAKRVNTASATTARPPVLHTPSPPTQHTPHGQRELDILANFVKNEKNTSPPNQHTHHGHPRTLMNMMTYEHRAHGAATSCAVRKPPSSGHTPALPPPALNTRGERVCAVDFFVGRTKNTHTEQEQNTHQESCQLF
jgi:hypothetical protein